MQNLFSTYELSAMISLNRILVFFAWRTVKIDEALRLFILYTSSYALLQRACAISSQTQHTPDQIKLIVNYLKFRSARLVIKTFSLRAKVERFKYDDRAKQTSGTVEEGKKSKSEIVYYLVLFSHKI